MKNRRYQGIAFLWLGFLNSIVFSSINPVRMAIQPKYSFLNGDEIIVHLPLRGQSFGPIFPRGSHRVNDTGLCNRSHKTQ